MLETRFSELLTWDQNFRWHARVNQSALYQNFCTRVGTPEGVQKSDKGPFIGTFDPGPELPTEADFFPTIQKVQVQRMCHSLGLLTSHISTSTHLQNLHLHPLYSTVYLNSNSNRKWKFKHSKELEHHLIEWGASFWSNYAFFSVWSYLIN
jgi:hypothetical protein